MVKDNSLLRALGPWMAIAVVVGNVIGSGIFLKPGNIAAESGNFGLIMGVWAFGGLLCILGALCFAELATMLPHAGGLYVYVRKAYGDLPAFLYAWTELFVARPASLGALAMAFVGSLTLGWTASLPTQMALAVGLVVSMAWVNILGVLWGGRLQLLTTIVKAGFLALVALSPLLLTPWSGWQVDVTNYQSTDIPSQAGLAAQIGAILLAVMWAYNGWEGVTTLAEEVREPQRNIPLALFGGIGVLIVLYMGANVAYHGVLTMEEMRQAGDHAAERMLLKLAGPTGRTAMSLVIMCSTFGAINSNLLLGPRISFAMGRDGLFFRSLGQVHANYRTPVVAIVVNTVMSVLLMAVTLIGKFAVRNISAAEIANATSAKIVLSLQDNSIFELLTNLVIFSLSMFYMLAVLAVIVLRVRQPDLPRPYRTWGYPAVPILFLAVYSWFLVQVYRGTPLESRLGGAFIAIGVPVFFLYRWIRRRQDHED
jgi:APA family basic amino acid/polyamine antiporter